LSSNQCHQG
ncbi:hypothetical protein EC80566_1250, partial [Escherichia coli 8.0566]